MKKLFLSFALLAVLALPVTAHAGIVYDWSLDFSDALNTLGIADVDHISNINVSGKGSIKQNLGGNGVLDVGDTFTSEAALFEVSFDIMGGTTEEPTEDTSYSLYFYSTNLAGEITGLSGLTEFSYIYTSGTVAMLIAQVDNLTLDGAANANDITPLADLTVANALGEGGEYVPTTGLLQGSAYMLATFDADPSALISPATVWPYLGLLFDLSTNMNPATDPTYYDANDNLLTGEDIVGGAVPSYFIANYTMAGDAYLYATPEPSTFLILGFGLLGLVGFRKKFKKA